METNAYILDFTIDNYSQLKNKLKEFGIYFENDKEDQNDIRAYVPYNMVGDFGKLIQNHLNAEQNYVDIQYPDKKITVLIFRNKIFYITNKQQNEELKKWAMSIGLPKEQADWPTSF